MAKRKDAFVKVPLWWIEQATRATKSPQAFVCVWLLHLAWKAGSMTFPLPNGQVDKAGSRPTRKATCAGKSRSCRVDHRRTERRQDASGDLAVPVTWANLDHANPD